MRPHILAVASTLALSGVACATGPIAHWRFDEVGGAVAGDSAGAFHAALVGSATFEPFAGVDGGAVRLTRLGSGHVRVGHVLDLSGEAQCTIVAWVRTVTSTPEQVVFGRYVAGGPGGYFMAVNQSSGGFGAPGRAWFYGSRPRGAEPISTSIVTDDGWHQIAVTRRLGLVRIYVDGAPHEAEAVSWPIPPTPGPLLIGGLTAAGQTDVGEFEGLIDDVQVYNMVLSDADIEFLFTHPGAEVAVRCHADLTHGAVIGQAGYGMPNCVVDNDDFFYYLTQFAAGNLAVADLTNTAVPGSPGYGVPNGVINNDDFFFYLAIFAAGC